MIEDVDYTASGYIQAIAPDGTVISRHRQEREAQQACFQHAKDNEDLLGDGVHDYILRSPDVRMSIRLLSVGGNPTNEDTTPPDPPAGVFNNSVTSSGFTTNWTNGPESDLQEHNVYRSSTGPSSGFSLVDTVIVPAASYSHTGLTAETQYWVYVTALDSSGNESVASSVVSSTTTAANSDPYVIQGAVPAGWDQYINWPTPPTITSSATLSDTASINNAIAAGGVHITVADGSYGALNFAHGHSDVIVEAQNPGNVSFSSVTCHGQRGIFRGIRSQGGSVQLDMLWAPYDVLIDNCLFESTGGVVCYVGGATAAGNTRGMAQRCAWINSTFISTPSPDSPYNFLVTEISPTAQHQDLIWANNRMTSTDSRVMRFAYVQNMIVADNYIQNPEWGAGFGGTGTQFRIHDNADNVLLTNNVMVGGSGTSWYIGTVFGGDIVRNCYFIGNKTYDNSNDGAVSGSSPASGMSGLGTTPIYMENHEHYAWWEGSSSSLPTSPGGWSTFSNNFAFAYQSPPAITQGASFS